MDQNPTNPGDGNTNAPTDTAQEPVASASASPSAPAGEPATAPTCTTCGMNVANGNCEGCGQNENTCTCPKAPTPQEPGSPSPAA